MNACRIPDCLRRCLLLPVILGLVSCDQIRKAADKVKSKVSDTLEEHLGELNDEQNKSPLYALVDQTEQGYVFRKDLEFPTDLRVVTTYKRQIAGRIIRETELGKNIENVNGEEWTIAEFDRKGSSVLYSLKESSFELRMPEHEDEKESEPARAMNPLRQAPPLTEPMIFVLNENGWKGQAKGNFKKMALSQDLSPVFGDMLVENAVMARPLWFAKRRIKVGDEFTISGAALPMLVAGKATGSLTLKLEGIEEVKGQPCGRFSVKGQFSRSNFPNLEGRLLDEEVSIQSGELWLSLIFPVILKEKIQTIQSFKPSEAGSTIGRGQGTIDTMVVREWHADISIPEPQAKTESEEDEPAEGSSKTDADSEA